MKEEAQLTFKPSVNQYNDVRAQLNLRHPEAYLAQVDAKRQAQLAQRLEERRTREVRPLALPFCKVLRMAQALADHGQRPREAEQRRVAYAQQAQSGLCRVKWSPHVASI